MQEEWIPIEGFPQFSVSNYGVVRNNANSYILAMRPNAQGIYMVHLPLDGKQYIRAVVNLVANNFLEPHPKSIFNTPIHLDGDRSNLDVRNLAWRPRWFAVKYHRQFREPNWYNYKVYIVCEETGEKFGDPYEAAMAYGLLAKDIQLDAHNQHGVHPGGYHFYHGDWK